MWSTADLWAGLEFLDDHRRLPSPLPRGPAAGSGSPAPRVDYTLEKYRDAQGQQRQAAAQELRVTMGKVEAELVRLMEGVVQRAKVPEFTPVAGLTPIPLPY